MPRAFGETVVTDRYGNVQPFASVDLVDPVTNVRIPDTIFADASSSTTLTLPLTADVNGRALWYLTTGKLVKAITTILGVTYADFVNTSDPTAAGGGGAGPHTHPESDVVSLTADLGARELQANKNVANGYAGLDGTTKILVAQLPTHTHAEADTTNLTTDLAGKSATGHSHTQQWQTGATFSAPVAGDLATAPRPSGAITPTAFYARRTGGTGATVDVKKNGTSLLTGTVSITTAATWTAGTLVASPSLAAGDVIEFDVVTIAGGPSEIVLSLDGTRTIT